MRIAVSGMGYVGMSIAALRAPAAPPVPKQASEPFLPFDAVDFARHIYGFARAYIVMPEAFTDFRTKFNKARLNEGDILIVEPRAFGGAIKVQQ